MEGYLDYLVNNGERYFPYTRVEGIIDIDGSPFSNWITKMNIHNHDIRYAASAHNHDTRYALKTHDHENYALSDHTHNYAGSNSPSGAALTALALDKEITLSVTGSSTGSVSFKGDKNISLNLKVNHNHDNLYIKQVGNNTITSDKNTTYPLTIYGNGGPSRLDFKVDGITDTSSIEFVSGALKLKYNNIPLDITSDGVSYNGKKLATIDDLAGLGGSGGSVDMNILEQMFAKLNHNHTTTDISDFPSYMNNQFPLKITAGKDNYAYDGSSEVNMIIDPSSLGCAAMDHTHDYSEEYAALKHTHYEKYLDIGGENTYKANKLNFEPVTVESLQEQDGALPNNDTNIIKSVDFLAKDQESMASFGSCFYYTAASKSIDLDHVFISMGKYMSGSSNFVALTMSKSTIKYNGKLIFHEGYMGHNSKLDADTLDGKHLTELPYVKGTEDIIKLGTDDKSKVEIDVSNTSTATILVRNKAGYIFKIKMSETSTDTALSISSGDVNMLTLTRDKSTNGIRTDLYGDIYHNGTKVTLK